MLGFVVHRLRGRPRPAAAVLRTVPVVTAVPTAPPAQVDVASVSAPRTLAALPTGRRRRDTPTRLRHMEEM